MIMGATDEGRVESGTGEVSEPLLMPRLISLELIERDAEMTEMVKVICGESMSGVEA